MDQSSTETHEYRLESQLREAFGRIVYTGTCHYKKIDWLHSLNNIIKISQIILSAFATTGFVVNIFSESKIASILGAIISLGLLILNSYAKSFNLGEISQDHKVAADALWKIREEYVSLLTDFESLTVKEIMEKRDELQERTAEVYSTSPPTDSKSYKAAQKALKTEEEQTFSEQEIDDMLPNSIRRSNKTRE
ncbi:SLATT domain-containing protein [Trichococcus pasteurii]|uniref:SMODS and SLOG-associating 2TM effector domain-containing protein n=1 Tax=Trichococcus pasteurii TaxID=43064 RepID=A0A1W1IJM7_9LACT|nr:SLATT domain-containing protein [Trichococcus pasteurii]SFF12639.1 hypothetical protein SAMN04488086_1339 [Trichococcus pasteurii]SLM53248.1 Hypothetical protein TPAS_2976 [Trichococcus pasteurii]SLM53265.1 Hypothetical protein TPAS_2993 [Trichococcus pasteurii]SSB94129.1 Hypothetical protein TPAS_2976 [Trichococcus pasteurii]SSB94146.1 Hypothetical protein TPAS_2993 [Trichococcus pasteurii]